MKNSVGALGNGESSFVRPEFCSQGTEAETFGSFSSGGSSPLSSTPTSDIDGGEYAILGSCPDFTVFFLSMQFWNLAFFLKAQMVLDFGLRLPFLSFFLSHSFFFF